MKRYFFFLWIIVSCSPKNGNFEEYGLTIGKEQVIKLGASGLSSEVPFKFSSLSSKDALIFNQFSRTIDTIIYNNEIFEIKRGIDVPIDVPQAISDFSFFWTCGDNLILFLTANSIIHWDLNVKEVKEIPFSVFNIFNSDEYIAISKGNGYHFNYSAFDCAAGNVFLSVKGMMSQETKIVQYNFYSNELKLLPIELNNDELQKNTIVLPNGLEAINFPDLLFFENHLIVSYNYKSDFEVFDLSTGIEQRFNILSDLFPNKKSIPKIENSQGKTIDAMKIWQDEVSFGSMGILDEQTLFRIVRGQKKGKVGEIFIELFNRQFQKIHEVSLSKKNNHLGGRVLTLEGKLWIPSLSQKNEDELVLFGIDFK
jgi:hypothetical protein